MKKTIITVIAVGLAYAGGILVILKLKSSKTDTNDDQDSLNGTKKGIYIL